MSTKARLKLKCLEIEEHFNDQTNEGMETVKINFMLSKERLAQSKAAELDLEEHTMLGYKRKLAHSKLVTIPRHSKRQVTTYITTRKPGKNFRECYI